LKSDTKLAVGFRYANVLQHVFDRGRTYSSFIPSLKKKLAYGAWGAIVGARCIKRGNPSKRLALV
tara:strand:- start:107 stop:301 length:195 start_codon:yes stop_codon:yes gene_type:complete